MAPSGVRQPQRIRSIASALALADQFGIPRGRYEFQMLYGMADDLKDVLVNLGQRVRIYTPYGQLLPGMAYLVRRLLENTSNESFLRASQSAGVPEEKLLMNPALRRATLGTHDNGKAIAPHAPGSAFRNEPLADFSVESNRVKMQEAIDETAKQCNQKYPLVIDGQEISTSAWIESINPSHCKQVVGRCGQATTAHAQQAIAAAAKAFPAWRDTEPRIRADYLFKVAGILRRRRFELAAWSVHECGKPWREADADIAEAIDFCDYYAARNVADGGPEGKRWRVHAPGEENEYFYEPRGVAVVIAPWNFPLAILCGMTAAALVTGNTVILKPAEPSSSVIAAKFYGGAMREAGIPAGVVNYLPGIGDEIGPTLVDHPELRDHRFHGVAKGGLAHQRVGSRASVPPQDHVKRVIAEMGGKNAVIVDADADLDEAVKGVVEGAFGYQGQKCSAGSRAIVLEPLYDQFLARLIETTKSLTLAPAEAPGCSVGPVIDAEARDRIRRAIEKGKSEASLVYAAELGDLADEGYYIGPHIFADVPETAMLAQEEIFGPVLAVMKARDLEHARESRTARSTR